MRIVLLLTVIMFSCTAHANQALYVMRVTPSGVEADNVKQINITFSKNMVALGDMNKDLEKLPIKIEPEINCDWRWVDVRNLACEFDYRTKLLRATEYKIKVGKDFKASNGESLKVDKTYVFETTRPKLQNASLMHLEYWESPVRPKISLYFNATVSKTEVLKHLKINQGKEIPYKFYSQHKYSTEQEVGSSWFIEATEDLEREASFSVELSEGIKSEEGELKGDNAFLKEFETPPYFRIKEFSCHFADKGRVKASTFQPNELGVVKANEGPKRCESNLSKLIMLTNKIVIGKVYQDIAISPDPTNGNKEVDAFSEFKGYGENYKTERLFLPTVLLSEKAYTFDLSKIENVFGEKLTGPNNFTMTFARRSPKVSSVYRNAVIESNIDNDLPVLVTNMEEFNLQFNRWLVDGAVHELKHKVVSPAPEDVSFYVPMKTDTMMNGQSGIALYNILEEHDLSSYNRNRNELRYSIISSPYQIYTKLGHYNSLAWVVDLQTGEAIKDAYVNVSDWGGAKTYAPSTKTDDNGLAILPGIAEMFPSGSYYPSYQILANSRFVTASKGKNFAVLPINYNYTDGKYYEDVSSYIKAKHGHLVSWGMTPQGVYKAGSKIDYKIYVRMEELKGLALPPDLTYTIDVIDPVGRRVYTQSNRKVNEFGTLSGSFSISDNAAVGTYVFRLSTAGQNQIVMTPLEVLVTDFTPAQFQVGIDIDKKTYKYRDKMKVVASAKMHSGGAFTGTDARISISFTPRYYQPKDERYKKFRFSNTHTAGERGSIHQSTQKLGDKGEYEIEYQVNEVSSYGRLFIESAVKDDRGKFISSMTSAEYFGDDKFFGGKLDKWIYQVGDTINFESLVIDPNSEIIKDLEIETLIKYEEVKSVKVKGSGNAFVTRNEASWVEVDKCTEKTKTQISSCSFKVEKSGRYSLESRVKGTRLNWKSNFYVAGSTEAWWGDDGTDDLSLEVSSVDLKVDQEIDVLIKNPLGKSKVLITVERYGIIDQWVEDVSSSAHVFKLKVKPDYIPGFYLSAQLFSSRVKEKSGFGELDLGKPTSRSTYKKFIVKDDYKRIHVDITSNKKVYQPNEEVHLQFSAKALNDKIEDVELAVAVLDEAVFDLIKSGDKYFDAYEGLSNLDSLDVRNFSLINMLIGRQKFEKKGANQGGGGGAEVRGNFDFLAYWNPSVVLSKGKGELKFKLPENLTGWKVIVMSADKKDRLGLSSGKFATQLPTELRAALPNYLVETDKFKARFSVYNREKTTRKITVTVAAAGLATGETEKTVILDMKPGERRYAEVNLGVGKIAEKPGEDNNYISFIVKAGDQLHTDTFVKQIPVVKRRPGYWAAHYFTLTKEKKRDVEVEFPKDIYPDVGGVDFIGSTTRIGLLDDGLSYLLNYPYTCWEQKLSKMIGAAQYLKLEKYFDGKISWKDAPELIQKTLSQMKDFQMPDGGMSYYGKYSSAYLSAYTLLGIGWLEQYGYAVDSGIKDRLITYANRMLKTDLYEDGYDKPLKNVTRAVFLAGLAQLDKASKDEIDRFAQHLGDTNMFGRLHYYFATVLASNSNSKLALETVLANLVVDAGSVRFNESIQPNWGMIHHSSRRTQCAALTAMTRAHRKNDNIDLVADLPAKLVTSVIKDMQTNKLFWDSTQNTIFCMNSLIEYAESFEREKPDLKLTIKMDNSVIGTSDFKDYSLSGKTMSYSLKPSDVGKKKVVSLEKEGTGTAYVKALVRFSLKDSDREFNNGINVKKVVSVKRDNKWLEVKHGTVLKRGELLNVDILVHIPTVRHYVVLDDPIAGGFEPLNSDLATTSQVDDEDSGRITALVNSYWKDSEWYYYGDSRYSFYHKELRHDRAVFYSELLHPGSYHVNYRMQVIATGEFTSMPVVAKEMYNPETFGSLTEMRIKIEE